MDRKVLSLVSILRGLKLFPVLYRRIDLRLRVTNLKAHKRKRPVKPVAPEAEENRENPLSSQSLLLDLNFDRPHYEGRIGVT
jgi:hypothetical protein